MAYEPRPDDLKRVVNDFSYHPPHGDQAIRYGFIRDGGQMFARQLLRSCPPSRELSLALTNLEQAVMWANAAIARNEKPVPPVPDSPAPNPEDRRMT